MIHPIRQKTPPNIYSHITAIQSLSDRDRGLCCFRTRFNFDNARRRKDMKAIDYIVGLERISNSSITTQVHV